MFLRQTLANVLKKNFDKKEAIKDVSAFSALDGEQGDRIIEHLCAKFKMFDSGRSKTEHEAGYDEGARAVITYLSMLRIRHSDVKTNLEVNS